MNTNHGTTSGYRKGCRCAGCKEAQRIACKKFRDAYRAKHGKGYYDSRERNRTMYERTCEFCGHTFTTRTRTARYCSGKCGSYDAAGWSKAKDVVLYVPAPKPTRAPLTIIPSNNWYTAGTCRVCGEVFVSRYMHITCSTECQDTYERDLRHEASHRRRAREREAYRERVVRRKVYERDGYRCHICGKATKRNARVPDHKAPTLDHIIPLNAGGTHEMANVATAHFLCNSLKSDKGTGDQLLLFG